MSLSALPPTTPRIIDTVPTEIWAEIFSTSHTSNELAGRRVYKVGASIFVTASQVCSKWRTIAVHTKALWTYIYHEAWGQYWQYPDPELVKLWLERSGSSPLSVEISFRTNNPVSSHSYACLLGIIHQSRRWRSASLDVKLRSWSDTTWRVVRQNLAQNNAPLLESFKIVLMYRNYNPNRHKQLPSRLWAAASAPALKMISLSIFEITSHGETESAKPSQNWTIQSKIPYAQITHLRINASNVDNIPWDTASQLFNEAPNLVSCFLSGVRNSVLPTFNRPATLHHLRYLHIATPQIPRGRDWILPGQIDRALIAPALSVLSFSECMVWDQDSFTRFIAQSSPQNLHELHFLETRTPPQDFLHCLRLCPTLQTLYVRDTNVLKEWDVLHALGQWDRNSAQFHLLPHLRQLALSQYEIDKWDHADISLLVTKFLKPRLIPPGGPSPTSKFSTLSIPQNPTDFFWVRGLQLVSKSPWNLEIVPRNRSVVCRYLWND